MELVFLIAAIATIADFLLEVWREVESQRKSNDARKRKRD